MAMDKALNELLWKVWEECERQFRRDERDLRGLQVIIQEGMNARAATLSAELDRLQVENERLRGYERDAGL